MAKEEIMTELDLDAIPDPKAVDPEIEEVDDDAPEPKAADDYDIDIEEVDDTPPEDRGRAPMPKEITEELEADELDQYTGKVKERLKQFKKVYHDERREKERVMREQQEAVRIAQQMYYENQQLRENLSQGQQNLAQSWEQALSLEVAAAEASYKAAYEEGDTDKMVAANNAMQQANIKLNQVKNYRPPLPNRGAVVQQPQQATPIPQPDAKTLAWQTRNTWWNTDEEMTAAALGLHQKLANAQGAQFVGTDDYYEAIDTTMRRRFPEYFEDEKAAPASPTRSSAAPSTVVAPATRTRSPKKIRLTHSQVALAKKLGVTPAQYAKEIVRLEKKNG